MDERYLFHNFITEPKNERDKVIKLRQAMILSLKDIEN